MTQVENQESRQLLDRMVEAKQLSAMDAETPAQELRRGSKASVQSEEEVLRWLAKAQEDLKKVLTVKQEAAAVLMGLLQ